MPNVDLILLVIIYLLTSAVGVVTGSNSLIAVPVMFQFGVPARIAVATNMFAGLYVRWRHHPVFEEPYHRRQADLTIIIDNASKFGIGSDTGRLYYRSRAEANSFGRYDRSFDLYFGQA